MQTYKTGNDSVFWTAEDGEWVPAEVARGLYEALDAMLNEGDMHCGEWTPSGVAIEAAAEALAVADGEDS